MRSPVFKIKTSVDAAAFFIGVNLDIVGAGSAFAPDNNGKLWAQFEISAASLTVSAITYNVPGMIINGASTIFAIPVCCGANKSTLQWWYDKFTE